MYNAAHWDGNKWELIRVPYVYPRSIALATYPRVFGIHANDIWFVGNGIRTVEWDFISI